VDEADGPDAFRVMMGRMLCVRPMRMRMSRLGLPMKVKVRVIPVLLGGVQV
jgi:hypothetical protein